MKTEDLNVPEILPLWVGMTSGAEFPPALPRDEALRRARELLGVLRKGTLSHQRIEADEDVKHVLYALCELLREPGRDGQLLLDDANAVYRFIESVHWPDDVLEEKSELLLECAEIGWGAIGLSVAEVTRRRLAEPLSKIHAFRTDPISTLAPVRRREDPLSSEAATAIAHSYLSLAETDRQRGEVTEKPEILFAVCRLLSDRRDEFPEVVEAEAAALFAQVRDSNQPVGLFDEKDYLLGELALTAAGAARLLGRWADAERWLSRAESSFRHVLNPTGNLAQVWYLRLALKFDQRQFDDVIELTPSLLASFERANMLTEYRKTEFLKGMCLKGLGMHEEAFSIFEGLCDCLDPISNSQLLGQALVESGAFHSSQCQYDRALETFSRALVLLKQGTRPLFLAHLKATVGETLILQGKLESGIEAYREAISDYASLGVVTQAAYLRLLLADALMQADRPREAEWELLAALPTVEDQKMVPEGFAAVALLKESVRRRKTDPNALRELREHLQASK